MTGNIPFPEVEGVTRWITSVDAFQLTNFCKKGFAVDDSVHRFRGDASQGDVPMGVEELVVFVDKKDEHLGIFVFQRHGNEKGFVVVFRF